MNITQQVNLTAGILALLPGLKTTAQNQQSAQHPNIIYIMSDDHAYQAISAYGSDISKLAPTPNIDRIAKAGVTFDQAFVENSLSLRKLDYTRDSDPDIDSWELYDLKADPNEVNNIFGQPGTEKITKDLKSMLNKYRKDLKVKEY